MSSIAAGKLISNALVHTSDRVGELVFKTNGTTTALTLDSAQDATFVGNVTIAGDLSVTGGSSGITIDLEDNKKLNLGNSNDMQIYHDGSNSIIADNGTGALILYGSDIILQKSGSSERLADFAQDGAARLYYDGSVKLQTYSAGVDINTTLTVGTDDDAAGIIQIFGNGTGEGAEGGEIQIYAAADHDGTIDQWTIDVYEDDLRFFAGGTVSLQLNGDTKVTKFRRGIIEEHIAVTSSSNATTIDLATATSFAHTLTENTTFTFSNAATSGTASTFILKLVQDASASGYVVTWPSSVDWPSATAPTLTATASAVDYFMFTTNDGGTTWYGFTAGQAMG